MARFKLAKLRIRGNAWMLDYTDHTGIRYRKSVGKDLQEAERIKLHVNGWLLEGKNPEQEWQVLVQVEQAQAIPLQDFFSDYMRRHGTSLQPNTQARYRESFKAICRSEELKAMPIGRINKPIVYDYIDLRLTVDNVKVATVMRDVTFLSSMLSWAVRWGLLDSNPLLGMKKPKEGGYRDVRISPEQVSILLEVLPPAVALIAEFAVYSGLRREEILGLRIEGVRFHALQSFADADVLVKGGNIETRTLGGPAVELLKEVIGGRTEGYVFCKSGTAERYSSNGLKCFSRAVRKLDLKVQMDNEPSYLRFHDLRHVTATWGDQAGIPRDKMQTILGHRTRAMTDRYTSEDRLGAAKAMEALPNLRRAS